MEFELGLAVVLVVLVIFVFLRTFAATLIPSLSAPLSLIGCLGVMYLLRFSLDNLSLMALTISTGFIVDDAIVMIENIARYVEGGEEPMQAALRGSGQIGFTIISLTVSLIAVLIPLLFMGDVTGRLFHEFAITLATTIVISAAVSLTLVPMMSARLIHHRPDAERNRFDLAADRGFKKIIEYYGRALEVVLDHQTATLIVALATVAVTAGLYIVIPKGFFPVQDVGLIQAISEGPQTASFSEMTRLQRRTRRRDPQGPGCREPELLHRRRWDQPDAERRPLSHRPEAFRSAQSFREPDHSQAQAGNRPRRRGRAIHAAGAGFDDRRQHHARAI